MAQSKKTPESAQNDLPVSLAIGIDNALSLLSQGRVEMARTTLQKSLSYACAIDSDVNEVVHGENRYEYPF